MAVDYNVVTGGVVPIAAYGAAGGGGLDDRDIIQTCFNEAPTGSTVVFPAGIYRLRRGLTLTRRLNVQAAPGARFVQAYDSLTTNEPCLLVTAAGSTITGMTVTGTDTPATYDTLYPRLSGHVAEHAAIAVRADGVTVRDVTVTSRVCGVSLAYSTRCLVDNVRVTGFGVGTTTSFLNYHHAIQVLAGTSNQVRSTWATGTGQTVLGGLTTTRLKVIGCYGTNLGDNGIYISSGNNCQILSYTVDTVIGSGVKIRGSHHSVMGCDIANAYIGVSATGTTTPIIEGRWGGQGLTIAANQIKGTQRHGIHVADQSSTRYYLRGVNINGNTLTTTGTDTGPQAPMHVTADDVVETGNLVLDHRGALPITVIPAP